MAKGYDTNQDRLETLSLFGKDLARRSKARCELSGEANVALKIYEMAPEPAEHDFNRCLFLSEATIEQLENPKKNLVAEQWRHLSELIWSELPQVQLMTVRILQWIAQDHAWAQEIIEEAYLDDAVLAEAEMASLGK
jgi:protein PhnA